LSARPASVAVSLAFSRGGDGIECGDDDQVTRGILRLRSVQGRERERI
jgi:hypothetical protein